MDVSAGGMLLVLGFFSDCHYTCGGGRWCGDCWIWVLEVVVCSDDVMVVMRWCCGEEDSCIWLKSTTSVSTVSPLSTSLHQLLSPHGSSNDNVISGPKALASIAKKKSTKSPRISKKLKKFFSLGLFRSKH
ncbi:hypothetical protein QL285_091739 [Trifolium repens]|nr:hypothetical protein QL285_091739 [Trifolium repens]